MSRSQDPRGNGNKPKSFKHRMKDWQAWSHAKRLAKHQVHIGVREDKAMTEQLTKHVYHARLSGDYYVATSAEEAYALRRQQGSLEEHQGDYFLQVPDGKLLSCDFQGVQDAAYQAAMEHGTPDPDNHSRLCMAAGKWAEISEAGYLMGENY